jgi:hypothetical protein
MLWKLCRVLSAWEDDWCREGESNPHSPFGPADFECEARILQVLALQYFLQLAFQVVARLVQFG